MTAATRCDEQALSRFFYFPAPLACLCMVLTTTAAAFAGDKSPAIHCVLSDAPLLLRTSDNKSDGSAPHPLSGPLPTYGCDDGSVIDIMIVYTTAARIAAGGTTAMNNNILQARDDANTAFSN